jgi:hypothetical protein
LISAAEIFAALGLVPIVSMRAGDGINGVLAEIVDSACAVIDDDLVGVYLEESFALSVADDESDCNLVVVSSAPIEACRLATLLAFHGSLPDRPAHWNRHLEDSHFLAAWPRGSRRPQAALGVYRPLQRPCVVGRVR